MKTFYTVLKLSPNTLAGDSLAIGLLVCQGNRYWLQISEHKKNVAKKLLGEKERSVDFVLKQLAAYLKQITLGSQRLFGLESFITAEYVDYLNVYANGLLQFSKTSVIDDDFDDVKFLKLYSLLIEKSAGYTLQPPPLAKTSDLALKVRDGLLKRVKDKIHTEVTLNDSVLKSLYFNFNIDCIGLNGSFVGAKSMSLDYSVPTLEKNVSHYVTLIALLSQQYNKDLNKNKFFLIADEPSKHTTEHKFWQEMKEVTAFSMIPSDEVHLVAETVESTGASKFL